MIRLTHKRLWQYAFALVLALILCINLGSADPVLANLAWIGNAKFIPENDSGYGGWTVVSPAQNLFSAERLRFQVETWEAEYGVNVEVCLNLNGGSFSCSPMYWVAVQGNNDLWQSELFGPWDAGDTVQVYFHAWKDATHQYDSNNSNNYTFNITAVNTSNDNAIYWTGLKHDSHNWPLDSSGVEYRDPFGAAPTSSQVVLKLRSYKNDLTVAQLQVYDEVGQAALAGSPFSMVKSTSGDFDTWAYTLTVPADPTILWYKFKAIDGADADFYEDDDNMGGLGQAVETESSGGSYQLTVYADSFTTPAWMQQGVAYQIFPDRFRNGDSANDPINGADFIYEAGAIKIDDWTAAPCNPRAADGGDGAGPCEQDVWSADFFGGDLQGIIDELDYLQELGVTVLYLNPIFMAPSNHLYDTQNYKEIDPYFGDLTTFQTLAAETDRRGIQIILDGVFNHVSYDSTYFDGYQRWLADGSLDPSGPGHDDDSGACESAASPYKSWFYFPHTHNPGADENDNPIYCYNDAETTFEAWYGYFSLPKLQANSTPVRELVWDDTGPACDGTPENCPVAEYWVWHGADGWRFDVGGDIDPGLEHERGTNDYWEGFRADLLAQKSDAIMLGEEWGESTSWLLGEEWDSVMNYQFRSAMLDWLFDSCSGDGCTDGTVFEDNDSNASSSSGAINAISISQLDHRLKNIQEDYPAPAWYAMMNLMGSHDTNRVLFLLKKISGDDAAAAEIKFKLLSLLQFTYPGAPTIYYGDEVNLAPDGQWDGSRWQDDPYNRATYPWADAGASPDADLKAYIQKLAVLRGQYPVLQTGAIQTLLTDDDQQVYAYARTAGTSDLAVTVLNRDWSAAHTVAVDGLAAFDGTILYDVLNCGGTPVTCPSYTVSGGAIANINAPSMSGAILVEGPLPAYTLTLAAAQNDLAINATTTLTATVTNLGGELAADGTQVNFSLVSGAGALSAGSAVVTGGQAVITYTAPATATVATITADSGSYAGAQAAAAVFVGYPADIADSQTQKLTIGPESLALSTTLVVTKTGLGEPVVTLAAIDNFPNAGNNMSGYVDVHLSDATDVDSLEIVLVYTNETDETNHKLYWFSEAAGWQKISASGANTSANTVRFTVTSATTPSLSDLSGTPFVVGNGDVKPAKYDVFIPLVVK